MKKSINIFLVLVISLFFCFAVTSCSINGNSSKESEESEEPTIDEGKISLSETAVSLGIDDEMSLVAAVSPSKKKVVWSVLNPEIATVDENGKIIAVAVGETVVSASIGDYVKAFCTVLVEQKLVPAYSIVLSRELTQICIGDIFTLVAEVRFGNNIISKPNIIWTSSAPEVITVSKGKLTALSEGNAIITAKYTGSDNISVEKVCSVSVIAE